jgi:cytochrome c
MLAVMPFRNQFIARWIPASLLLAAFGMSAVAPAGEEQMTRFGCYSCHRVKEKLIGPAFRDVAARYRSDTGAAEYLFQKVRAGGEGAWGDVPMVANTREKIPDDELRTLIAWIRSL